MPVFFSLLGDIQAWMDGRPLDLGHKRQRSVLALLLIDANRTVSVDELIDRTWAEHTPQRARQALYTYISRLRRAMVDAAGVSITHQPAGYLLAVDPAAVDLHEFRRLVSRADGIDDDNSYVALEAALGLWRGEAFAGIDTQWLNNVRADLEMRRRAARLDYIDLALRRGEHARILTDLSATFATQPLDERMAAQLMLALYRGGRQAEALTVYQRTRQLLADELGANPSPPLGQLHQRILRADAALAAPATGSGPFERRGSAQPVPRQLPTSLGSFVGRGRALAQLDAMLTDPDQPSPAVVVFAVSGTAGVGKSALAVHWTRHAAAHFPDGQLYVNLLGFDPSRPAMEPADALRGFLEALGVRPDRLPSGQDALVGLYRSTLAGKRVLVLLDNARNPAQVRPLLPGTPGCAVVVTSRNELSSLIATDGAHALSVDLLSTDEARDLLARRIGRARVNAEPTAVDELIDASARLPLALAVVAGRAARHPDTSLYSLARELRHAAARLDGLTDTDATTDVRDVFSCSYRTLTPPAARLFGLLALHPGPDAPLPAIASLMGGTAGQARLLLTELAEAGLITEPVRGRFTLHDLLRAYATETARSDDQHGDQRAALQRLLTHYLHTAYAADRLIGPDRDLISIEPRCPGVTPESLADPEAALAWLTAEHAIVAATIDQAVEAGFLAYAWQLAWSLTTFFQRRGHWQAWVTTQRAGVAAAERLNDRPAHARARRLLAHAYTRLGRLDEAATQLQHALELHRELGDQRGQARIHLTLASLTELRGDHERTFVHLQRAAELHPPRGAPVGPPNALNTDCSHPDRRHEHRAAVIAYLQAISLVQEMLDKSSQAVAWAGLGNLHHRLHHDTEAVACYEHALAIFRRQGDRYLEADSLAHLGDIHHTAGRLNQARRAWQPALAILEEVQHPHAQKIRAKLQTADEGTVDLTAPLYVKASATERHPTWIGGGDQGLQP